MRPFTFLSYHGILAFEVDILRRAEVSRERETREISTEFTVVDRDDVEERYEGRQQNRGTDQAHPD